MSMNEVSRAPEASSVPTRNTAYTPTLVINANTGDIVWRVPLGEYKELTAKGIPKTGTATNSGAPMATAGGLVFIGGTSDGQFRAFDAMTGQELWSASPGFNVGDYAISYRGANGKQYVVISGPRLVAYALP